MDSRDNDVKTTATITMKSPSAPKSHFDVSNTLIRPSQEPSKVITPHNDKFGIDTVDITVGPPGHQQTFRVHKARLCRRIPFFTDMFSSPFVEGTSQIANFPEDDPAVFDVLLEWVYNYNQRKLRTLGDEKKKDGSVEAGRASWDVVGLYALAEKLLVKEVMDLCMDAVLRFHHSRNIMPSLDFVRRAYMQTAPDGKLRLYAVKCLVTMSQSPIMNAGWDKSEVEVLLREVDDLLADFLEMGHTGGVGEDPRMAKWCFYHVHREWDICSTTGKRCGVRKDGTSRRKRGLDATEKGEVEREAKRFKKS